MSDKKVVANSRPLGSDCRLYPLQREKGLDDADLFELVSVYLANRLHDDTAMDKCGMC